VVASANTAVPVKNAGVSRQVCMSSAPRSITVVASCSGLSRSVSVRAVEQATRGEKSIP
jgi:hypothetical protein